MELIGDVVTSLTGPSGDTSVQVHVNMTTPECLVITQIAAKVHREKVYTGNPSLGITLAGMFKNRNIDNVYHAAANNAPYRKENIYTRNLQ